MKGGWVDILSPKVSNDVTTDQALSPKHNMNVARADLLKRTADGRTACIVDIIV